MFLARAVCIMKPCHFRGSLQDAPAQIQFYKRIATFVAHHGRSIFLRRLLFQLFQRVLRQHLVLFIG